MRRSPCVRAALVAAAAMGRTSNHLLLRRGPYVIAAGLDESIPAPSKVRGGRFIDLLDPELPLRERVSIEPGGRYFLRDLEAKTPEGAVLAAACKTLPLPPSGKDLAFAVEGVSGTSAVVLLRVRHAPRTVPLDNRALDAVRFSKADALLGVRFVDEGRPRTLRVQF